ncbi:hypothetical protein MTO96_017006 [Rhipicephalus appendiculatus]
MKVRIIIIINATNSGRPSLGARCSTSEDGAAIGHRPLPGASKHSTRQAPESPRETGGPGHGLIGPPTGRDHAV